MVWTVRVGEEEGSVLEAAVRRVRLGEPESAIGRRWVEGGEIGGSEEAVLFDAGVQGGIRKTDVGLWAMVVMPEAAVVINPVARRLVEQMRNAGIEVEWVQHSLERRREELVDHPHRRRHPQPHRAHQ